MSVAGLDRVQNLPAVLRIPLSEPLFVLGTIFIMLVLFLPVGSPPWRHGSPARPAPFAGHLERVPGASPPRVRGSPM